LKHTSFVAWPLSIKTDIEKIDCNEIGLEIEMAEDNLVFPPSPNWYNFKVSALNVDSTLFAYGAKNTVCVFEIIVNDEEKLDFKMNTRLYGHTNSSRISGVEFAKADALKSILITGCTCGELRIWNVEVSEKIQDIPIYTISPHNNQQVTVIALSCLSPDLIISADEKGVLAINFFNNDLIDKAINVDGLAGNTVDNCSSGCNNTNSEYNNNATWEPVKNGGPISSVVCSPYIKNYVVVGYRNGAIAVFDWRNLSMVNRLHGHKQEIQNISFLNPQIRDRMNINRKNYLKRYYEKEITKNQNKHVIAMRNNSYSLPVNADGDVQIYNPDQLRALRTNKNEYVVPEKLRQLYHNTIVNMREHINKKYCDVPKLLITSSQLAVIVCSPV
jgi:hypothetical protein